jgi:uncharacterized protein (UPF0333 family)
MEIKDDVFAKLFINTGSAFLHAINLYGSSAENAKNTAILTPQQLQNVDNVIKEMERLRNTVIFYLKPVAEQLHACQNQSQNGNPIQ